MKFFIAGTDTGVGKTRATAILARAMESAGLAPIALKPVCSGPRDDAEILRAACGDRLSLDDVNPLWLPEPLAPYVAAKRAGVVPDLAALRDWFARVSAGRDRVLVEGAGGWLVPLAPGLTMADLAGELGLPVLLVAANRRGCVNHILLTLESVRARGLACAGIILNSLSDADESSSSNRGTIEEFSGVPVILEIAWNQEIAELPPSFWTGV